MRTDRDTGPLCQYSWENVMASQLLYNVSEQMAVTVLEDASGVSAGGYMATLALDMPCV